MQVVIDSTEDTWNYYSADVTITRDAAQNEAGQTNATTQTTHNIVRTLSGDTWASTLAFDPLPSMGVGTTPSATIDLAQLDTDDGGDYLNVYSRDGAFVGAPPPLTDQYPVLDPPPGHDPMPAPPTPPSGAVWNRMAPTFRGSMGISGDVDMQVGHNHAGHRVDPRAWIANVVVTRRNRVGLAAGRARHLGPPIGSLAGMQRFVHTNSPLTIEELVDPISGGTVERNVALNGQLISHMTQTFADAGGGRYVLAHVHVESVRPGSTARPRVFDVIFNNVHLETRAKP